MSSVDRSAATNGIWLCQVCAKLIDSDVLQFPVDLLRAWKKGAEERADQQRGRAMSISSAGIAGLDQKLSALLAIVQSPPGPSADQIDGELDEVKQELERHDLFLARRLVERVLNRRGTSLTDRQKWRAKTQLATTFLAEGDVTKGAGLLIEAVRLQPTEEKARTNEAVAFELLQNRPKAHELARQLKQDFPHSGTALATWVRTAPDDIPFEELERESGALAGSNAEVCIALADRLSDMGDCSRAESYARTAVNLESSWPQAWLALAQVLHRKGGEEVKTAPRGAVLQEAAECYSRTIGLATAQQEKRVTHFALVNRGLVRECAEQFDLAADDFRQAIQLLPNNPEAIDRYATFLAQRGRHDEAVEQARRAAELAPYGRHEFLFAATLYDRDHGDDRRKAVEIWRRLVSEGTEEVRDRAADCAVLGLCDLKRQGEAEKLLGAATFERVTLPVRRLCEARIRLAVGARDDAIARARDAIAVVDETAVLSTRLSLTHLLVSLGLDAEVIPLLTPAARPGAFDVVTRCLLDCAQRTDNHGLFLRLCAELREAGVRDDNLRRNEFEMLARYDPLGAASLVNAYLCEHPDDRLARLRLTFLGIQCDRPDWVTTSLDQLPHPCESQPATIGRMVLSALHHAGRGLEALRFAYGLLRAHPNDPDANHAYISVFLLFNSCTWPLAAEVAGPDVAVCVREVGKEVTEWLVIEADSPNELAGEYAPDHRRITPLLNLGVGAQFIFAPGIKPRMGEIVAIQSKYLFRFEQTRDSYQSRFHERHDFQMVEVVQRSPDGTEQVDLSAIFAAENQHREYIEGIVEQYKSRLMPIHLFAHFIGRDVFEAMDALRTPGLGIRCWNGADNEWAGACEQLREASTIVLDVTALSTLSRLGLLSRRVVRPDVSFVIGYGTLAHIRELASEESNPRQRAHWVPDGNGSFTFQEIPEEFLRQEHESRAAVERWVSQNCTTVACRELAALPPERRRQLVEVFGRDGAESVCLATRPGHVLWTDDLTLSVFAREWLSISRITWTQVGLWHAVEVGMLPAEEYSAATAQLIGRGYTSLRIDSAAIAAAGVVANWSPSGWPLSRALEVFQAGRLQQRIRFDIAKRFVLRLFYSIRCHATRKDVVFALLDRFASVSVAWRLRDELPLMFHADVFNALAARGIVRSWLMRRAGPAKLS